MPNTQLLSFFKWCQKWGFGVVAYWSKYGEKTELLSTYFFISFLSFLCIIETKKSAYFCPLKSQFLGSLRAFSASFLKLCNLLIFNHLSWAGGLANILANKLALGMSLIKTAVKFLLSATKHHLKKVIWQTIWQTTVQSINR